MQSRYLLLISGFFLVIFSFLLHGDIPAPVTAQSSATPTPTTVPPNQSCGDICNPQYGDTACSGGLNCSSSSILLDNLIPDPVHALGICATENLVYQRACMDDILDNNSTIPNCCQVTAVTPTNGVTTTVAPTGETTITAVPTGTSGQCPKKNLGDANCDDSINTADFEIWKNEFTRIKNTKDANFDNDNAVTLQDFEIWRRNQEVRQRDE